MITILGSVWQQMISAIEKLTQGPKNLQIDYELICDHVKQYSELVESIDP